MKCVLCGETMEGTHLNDFVCHKERCPIWFNGDDGTIARQDPDTGILTKLAKREGWLWAGHKERIVRKSQNRGIARCNDT